MFRALRSSRLPEAEIFTVTVGASSKQTLASYYVPEPLDVIGFIEAINKSSSTTAKNGGNAQGVAAGDGLLNRSVAGSAADGFGS